MAKAWGVLVFDVLFPLTSAAAFVTIGVALDWPLWWAAVCAVLCLFVAQTMAANLYVLRRVGVSIGTDPHIPSLRVAAAALTAASTVAAVFVGYTHCARPDLLLTADVAEVVHLATSGPGLPDSPGTAALLLERL
jgi:hypothetical protein